MPVVKLPDKKADQKKLPQKNEEKTVPAPEYTERIKEAPEYTESEISAPQSGHLQNIVYVEGVPFEIKATGLKYQRDRTAAFYKILQQLPVVDILAMPDDTFDDTRTPDKMLYDWLVAVFDDQKFVRKHYDKFDSEVIEQCLNIFCRLNHIDEREERKNRQAQAGKTTH